MTSSVLRLYVLVAIFVDVVDILVVNRMYDPAEQLALKSLTRAKRGAGR
jgi:hypothetical protein